MLTRHTAGDLEIDDVDVNLQVSPQPRSATRKRDAQEMY